MKEFEECGKMFKSYQQRQDIASRIYRVSHQFYFVHKINPKQSSRCYRPRDVALTKRCGKAPKKA